MSCKAPDMKLKGMANDSSSDEEEDYDSSTCNDELDLGLSLDKLNLGPKKKLLILGLGGLLVHRVYRRDPKPANQPRSRRPDSIAGNFLVFKRPFCSEFLKFCLERFEVGLWSSARERNVDLVLEVMMKGLKDKLLFTWDQEECTDSGFKCLENSDKPVFLKDLTRVWDHYALKRYSPSNTLFVDEEPYKCLLNPPNTAVFPTAFTVDMVNDRVLAPKGELWNFLDGLADADNVQSYVKEHRIGQSPITTAHSNWAFYSKIKRRYVKE